RNLLTNGEGLYAGQSLDVEPYHFIMQEDCNLVLYDHSTSVWASNTGILGKKGCKAVLQSDGNFVVYDAEGRSLWASHSVRGNGNYVLVLQEDGNVVIYGSDIWSTGTYK
uniref:lectin I n=1 Tax=Allium sativum TaxID=4682 RepID=UPI00001121A5|nr:Chain A, lectin I [Allium sativum]1KJ1_P Chain P, lectin I [Allium sativum]